MGKHNEMLGKRVSANEPSGMSRTDTQGSVAIPMDMLEKLYLNPPNKVKGHLRETFANPTPLGVIGISVALTPLSTALMGWRGAGNLGIATTTAYIWFGGLLLFLAALGEFLLGNTFSFCVFGAYGAYFLTFATTFMPFFNATGSYSPDPTKPWLGVDQPEFLASFAFFFVVMFVLNIIFLICSLRTNAILVGIFFGAVIGFGLAAGSDFAHAAGNPGYASKALVGTGACFFVSALLSWYELLTLLMESVDFPLQLPVGDLSQTFKGRKQLIAMRKGQQLE